MITGMFREMARYATEKMDVIVLVYDRQDKQQTHHIKTSIHADFFIGGFSMLTCIGDLQASTTSPNAYLKFNCQIKFPKQGEKELTENIIPPLCISFVCRAFDGYKQ